jgi:hypothetical protein
LGCSEFAAFCKKKAADSHQHQTYRNQLSRSTRISYLENLRALRVSVVKLFSR